MTNLLIFLACAGMAAVTWISVAAFWIVKQLKWLRAVLIPYLAVVAKLINPSKQ